MHGFAVDRIIERNSPEDALALLLATGAEFRRQILKLCAAFREMDVEYQISIDRLPAVDRQARLESLCVGKSVRGLRLPQRHECLGE